MESTLSDYLKLFLTLIIPGFIYLLSAGILIKIYLNINIWSFIKKNNEFSIHFGLIIIILSFLFGLIIYLVEEQIISWLTELEIYTEPIKEEYWQSSDYAKKLYENVYGVLMMLRHLIYSLSIFYIFLVLLFKRLQKKVLSKWFILISYILFYAFTLIAYYKIRSVITSEDIPYKIFWFFILIPITPIIFICKITFSLFKR